MRGKIIVIEGTDCSGKETQATLLVQRLKKEGYKVERLSFPNYDTPTGKIVGGPYLGKEEICGSFFSEGSDKVDPKVSALYYAADRRYNKEKITSLLDQGINVVLDRYVESNMGCQGGKILDKEERLKLYNDLSNLEYGFLELPRPDITILLHMPSKMVAELIKGRASIDGNEKSMIFIKNAENAYLELATLHNYKTIKCTTKEEHLRDILEIHEELYESVLSILNSK